MMVRTQGTAEDYVVRLTFALEPNLASKKTLVEVEARCDGTPRKVMFPLEVTT